MLKIIRNSKVSFKNNILVYILSDQMYLYFQLINVKLKGLTMTFNHEHNT